MNAVLHVLLNLQVLDLKPSELKWVCAHFGHTLDVHESHYKQQSDVIERLEVAKILLMQDNGMVKECVGKRLQDIQFSGGLNVCMAVDW